MLKILFDYVDETGKRTSGRCGPITSITNEHVHMFDETHGEPRCFRRYRMANVRFYLDNPELVEFVKENS